MSDISKRNAHIEIVSITRHPLGWHIQLSENAIGLTFKPTTRDYIRFRRFFTDELRVYKQARFWLDTGEWLTS